MLLLYKSIKWSFHWPYAVIGTGRYKAKSGAWCN
jgi:hypothetical protein